MNTHKIYESYLLTSKSSDSIYWESLNNIMDEFGISKILVELTKMYIMKKTIIKLNVKNTMSGKCIVSNVN